MCLEAVKENERAIDHITLEMFLKAVKKDRCAQFIEDPTTKLLIESLLKNN